MDKHPVGLAKRLLSYLIICLLAGQPVFPAVAATINPVTPGTQMDQAGNGVPVVNIATPNQAGISHNQFQDYNVGKEGLILNNATGQLTQTQLGGLVQNNPNLRAGQEATGIINEVVGGNRSQLQGYTEVAGKAANVMVANPYGITCNGCGFINTPNATLTTGKPQFDAAGNLLALDVSKGTITVEGQGLDASKSDALSIIARATEVNAGIHAKDLKVTVGANRVSSTGAVTPIAGEGAAPVVAVDTGALGGMYANRIHLVSSDKGVGVNLGNLNARQGDITLDASGKLVVNNSLASGNLTAQADNVVLSGEHKSGGATQVNSRSDITVANGKLASDRDITLNGSGKLALNNGQLAAGNDITLNAGAVSTDAASEANAGGAIRASAATRMDNAGKLTAGRDVAVSADQLINSGQIAANGNLNARAGSFNNSGNLQAQRDVQLEGKMLVSSGTIQSAATLGVRGGSFDQQGILSADGDVDLTLTGMLRNNGSILGAGHVVAHADTLEQSGILSAKRNLNVETNVLHVDKSAQVTGQGNVALTGNSEANIAGQVNAGGALDITGKQIITRTDAQLQSGQNLTLLGQSVELNGTQAAKGSISAKAQVLGHGGKSNADKIELNVSQGINNSGTLVANKLGLSSQHITNSGLLQGSNLLNLDSLQLENVASGTLYSAKNLTLGIPRLANSGLITTDGVLHLSGDTLINSGEINGAELVAATTNINNLLGGRVLAEKGLAVSGQTLNNDGLLAGQNTQVKSDAVTNGGVIQGTQTLAVKGRETKNLGKLLAGDRLTVSSTELSNAGDLQATELLLSLKKLSAHEGGMIKARTLTLTGDEVLNEGLLMAETASLSGLRLNNHGTLQAEKLLTLDGQNVINLSGGQLLSAGQLNIRSAALTNAGLIQGDTLDVATTDWTNTGNTLSQKNGKLSVSATLSNQGNILGQNNLQVEAGNLDNEGVLASRVLDFKGDLVNAGLLQGVESLGLAGNLLSNLKNGRLLSGNELSLEAQKIVNEGTLQGQNIRLSGVELRNDGLTQAQSQLSTALDGELINGGTLLSQKDAVLTANVVTNSGKLAADTLSTRSQSLENNGLLQGNSALQLQTSALINLNGGQIVSGAALTLLLQSLNNAGLLQVRDLLSLTSNQFTNSGDIAAGDLNLSANGPFVNQTGGRVLADNRAVVGGNLANNGAIAAQELVLNGHEIANSGVIQGKSSLTASAGEINNQGNMVSGGLLTLTPGSLINGGSIQGSKLSIGAGSLANYGALNGENGLHATVRDWLDNKGQIWSRDAIVLNAGNISNSGKIAGRTLDLQGASLSNDGLWQGTDALNASGNTLITGRNGRVLSDGMLALVGTEELRTAGSLQGKQTQIHAGQWLNEGTALATGSLQVNVDGTLANSGEILSRDSASLRAETLHNTGSLLSDGDMQLDGDELDNQRSIQGKTLVIHQGNISNQGTLIGLNALTFEARKSTLMARMEMAAPQRMLMNSTGGQLLTQGVLTIDSGEVVNNGDWQGQQILLNAMTLQNNGTIQSADGINLSLADGLTSGTGSKISANGSAALRALSLVNNGQWVAKNLSLSGDSFSQTGDMSTANNLTIALKGGFTQQQGGALVSGNTLDLQAASLVNQGRVQGNTLKVSGGTLENHAVIQGDSNVALDLSGELINRDSGKILSQKDLTLAAPNFVNYGIFQGGGSTRIHATSSVLNNGRLLSGGDMTFETGVLNNNSQLQATTLLLTAARLNNTGTLLAEGQATLGGSELANAGTLQAGNLDTRFGTVNNSGTLLGTNQLTLTADRFTHQAGAKLFSGGNLLLNSGGFDQFGQIAGLGNVIVEVTNAFTVRNSMAAGNALNLHSGGDITNQSTLQGQGVNVRADGVLTNNGQIAAGSGASSLSGSRIALNGGGTLQSGGDVSLNSNSDIVINGFTGTRGSLTASAVGSLVNTALLYAGNNLSLFANSIRNQKGDILAGNNLWMQRDAAGNANAEIINTSGTIETQNGDIALRTGHLLNQWESITAGETKTENLQLSFPTTQWDLPGTVNIPVSMFKPEEIEYINVAKPIDFGMRGPDGGKPYSWPSLINQNYEKEFAVSRITYATTATGSAGRIASGRDLTGFVSTLDNLGSFVLAGRNVSLAGNTLNNQSWQSGTQTVYRVFKLTQYEIPDNLKGINIDSGVTKTATPMFRLLDGLDYFVFDTTERYRTEMSPSLRAVLQGNGSVALSFSTVANNSDSTDVRGTIGNSLTAPTLQTQVGPGSVSMVRGDSLVAADKVAVGTPQWRDSLQNALQQINGGAGLDSGDGNTLTLGNYAVGSKGDTALGGKNSLADANVKGVSLVENGGTGLNDYRGKRVDTSAYPLPTGQNGYFVTVDDPKSPYLIVSNPKLGALGELDPALFGDLYAMLGHKPGESPRETNVKYTDEKTFLGSAYFMSRLNVKPEYDYRFLGDAAFDTRYVSNSVLNQTGSRYLNGVGSDLQQMQYLIDNAAQSQRELGLKFGVSLTAEQIAALNQSILWWEAAVINGETVMVPKLYLSSKDVTINNGSIIAGNNVGIKGGAVSNTGSTMTAKNALYVESESSINNLNHGLMSSDGDLKLGAIGDINNVGSTLSGKSVALESVDGSINNLTQFTVESSQRGGQGANVYTTLGEMGAIKALDDLSLSAGKDIKNTGANLAAGGDMLLKAWGDIAITENQLTSSYTPLLFTGGTANSRQNAASSVTAGGSVGMQAGQDITLSASSINAGKDVALQAGNTLNLNSAQNGETISGGRVDRYHTGVDRTTISSGGNMTLAAGQDINSQAAGLAAEGDVALRAGKDINLQAEAITRGDSYKSGKKAEINDSVRQQATEIASGGNTTVIAGHDVNSEAAQVTARGDIGVGAGHDINLLTATESDYHYDEQTKTKKGFLSKKTTHTINETSSTREAGTLLSGDNVTLKAGNDLLVKGSSVVGDGNVALNAGNNVDIVAATETNTSWHFKETKKSGLMGTGGIGFTIGSSKSTHDLREQGTTQSQSISTVGSTGGNVSVNAGGMAHIGGADLVAGKDLSVSGNSVLIEPGHDKRTRDEKFEQKSTGLTVALSGAVGDAINNAVTTAQATKNESDGRLAALQATKTALAGGQAYLNSQQATASADPNNGVGVSISLTTQKSKSEQHMESDKVNGSSLTAGNNLNISANGKGNSADSGNLLIGGSQLKAGGDTSLSASNDIVLSGAANTQLTTGKNSSSGGGVGLSIGVGSGSGGISVFANVNAANGKEKGNGTAWTETTVDSGGTVSLTSGRDAILNGAQVNGNKISADIGRDLLISSQQDSNRFDSKQTSVAAGGSFTFGSMTGSGYINASQDKMKSTYDSVQEQSGLFAGKDGFDITVGRHTQLDGAVIASTATADKNSLDTGTLGFSDIGNKADYKVSHSGISLSGGTKPSAGSMLVANGLANVGTLLAGMNGKGHAEGTTQSAVAEGNITIRDRANQQQDVAALSRDTEHANGSIGQIFNKEEEQKRLQTAQLVGEIGGQMTNMVSTYGDTKALEAVRAEGGKYANMSAEALRNTEAYQKAFGDYGIGGKYQMVAQSVSGILAGAAGGDFNKALAGGLNPVMAQVIKGATTKGDEVNEPANLMAHAVWGALAAQLSGGNAAAGAAGAFSGELAARHIAAEMFPDTKLGDLNQDQKQLISLLGTMAAGIAGGVVGNSTAAATTGAQAGKNAVENNGLSGGWNNILPSGAIDYGQSVESYAQYAQDNNLTVEQTQAWLDKLAKGDLPDGANITKVIVNGYKDGVLIAGAAYLGPAASLGKAVGGAVIAEIANGTYQWFDINSEKNLSLPENQQKTWDYKGSVSAGITGLLAPGRGVWQSVGIAAGGAVFSDGADVGSVGIAAGGAGLGWGFGEYAPKAVNLVTGKEVPGFVFDAIGSLGTEFLGGYTKDLLNAPAVQKKTEKEKELEK
ncbi:hemagglutinin repeat-containing protein [Cedecea neteri]|uniref:hemagglutinin repeat-containing protein n=1 Tax=Cedecea neteri TaxID=158822 RepID=UPI002892D05D|nr:hemagglutinin repeat-containing protein [Cedecea neteri]WNJ81569.1 hemagglutinin repeat-containing protein [Cedecea neteri]